MPNYVEDDAVCLRVTDFSETSQIVALFTRRHGVVPMIAKGTKRQSKTGNGKMSSPLDVLTGGEVMFLPAKGTAELATLAGWELTDHRPGLRSDLRALNAALICAELTLSLLHVHDPHETVFDELQAALALLPTGQRARAVVAYAKAVLTGAGYQPHLDACVECGAAGGGETARFSPREGGIVCNSCPVQGSSMLVPVKIVIALDRLPGPKQLLAEGAGKAADAAALQVAFGLLLAQVEAILDRAVKTRFLVDSVFGAGAKKE